MNPTQRAYLELHIAVLLYGITAILGDLITLPATILVWWRVLITTISLFFLIRFGANLRGISKKLILQYMGIGVLVALHWITFFGAIKLSNASICLVCLATTSFFTSFLEPLILKRPFKLYELAIGLVIIPGMALVVSSTDWSMFNGILMGLVSAFLAAMFTILNKKLVDKADPMSITFLEMGSSWLFISLLLPFYFFQFPDSTFGPQGMDWIYLMVLALLCTTLAYILSLRALKYISAFAANLTINLEPVYGILLAWLILEENKELSLGFYIGCGMILFSVFSYPFIRKRFDVS